MAVSKGNKILLSLVPILMQTKLAPHFLDIFFVRFKIFDANKKYNFVLRNFLILYKFKKEDNLTSASAVCWTCVNTY